MSIQSSGGSRISQKGRQPEKGAPTYYLAKICRKLHENEENWDGGGASNILLCRSATAKLTIMPILSKTANELWFFFPSYRLFGSSGTCSACGQSIPASEFVMRAQTNVYHLNCFTCVACNSRLVPGDRYSLFNGSLICEHDYPKVLKGHTQIPLRASHKVSEFRLKILCEEFISN